MRRFILGGALVLTSPLFFHSTAHAQERAEAAPPARMGAPANAFELRLGSGYTQGFGNIAPSRGIPNVAGAGLGLSLDADYRLDPQTSFGFEAQYQEFDARQQGTARGMAANIGVTAHFAPTHKGDPWARLGTGYRLLWENDPFGPNTTVLTHGFEAATLKIGYDARLTEDFAIAPFVGADLNVFVWQVPNGGTTVTYNTAQFGTFLYAGVQARFDMGGTRVGAGAPQPVAVTAAPVVMPEPAPAPPPVTPTPPPPATPTPPPPTTPVAPSVAVSPDIMEQCKLQLDSPEKAPKFDTKKADLLPQDLEVLNQIATCFSTGPMKGMNMTLIGRADPRGTRAYNEELGKKRAKAVADYLESRGVQGNQIDETSRGELDAEGHDKATWAKDRRVDILQRE